MSEEFNRNLESVAPEAAEDIQEQTAEAAEPVETEAEEAQVHEPEPDDRENAPAPKKPKKGGKKKKRRKRSALVPLIIVLMLALLIFGVLVGYGLARVRSIRAQQQATAQQDVFAAGFDALGDIPEYDVFNEALTQENQQALDTLSGANGFFDDNSSALMGEDALFAAGFPEGESPVPAVDPVVVAEFGDGEQVMSDEILAAYNEQLTISILSGYSEAEIAETLLDDVLRSTVSERVLAAHARELGLYELSSADRAEIESRAKEMYELRLDYYRENVVNGEGMTEAEIDGAAKAYLLDFEGVTLESLRADIEETWWQQKLYAQITDPVTVSDEDVLEAYNARLAEQKADFEAYPDNFEFSQANGELIVYNLPGYRAVKMLLLGFDDQAALSYYVLASELAALDGEAAAEHLKEHQADLDALYADSEAAAQAALEQLREGADMDELILSTGADEGMKDDRLRATGYYVSENSSRWSRDFIKAVMGLKNVGDYSEPLRVENGVCILQYLGEVTEGDVPLEDVRAALEEETLVMARYTAYIEQMEAWMDEANPSYYPERMH